MAHERLVRGVTSSRIRRGAAATNSGNRVSAGWPFACLAVTILALWIGWVGFIASDDALYQHAAEQWLAHPPFAGDSHWATRFPVVLSLAAMLGAVGRDLLAFHLTSLLWYALLIGLTGRIAWRMAGGRAGWIAATLTATLPVVATNGSIVNCDLPEVFFMLAGAWLLAEARGLRGAAAAGVCFGLAILCRETAILALAGLALPFVIGRPVSRRLLIAAGLGALVVLGAEMLFQFLVTGDPLHRYGLAAHHDATIDRAANREGNLLVHPLLDPLLVLLVNNEFGLLFWFGIVALMTGGGWRAIRKPERRGLIVIGTMALASFLLVGLLQTLLVLNPRYFTFAAIAMVLLVAGWLSRLRSRSALVIIGAIVASNLILLGLTNAHPRWPAEALALAARQYPGTPIAAELPLVERANLFLRANGAPPIRPVPPASAAFRLVMAPPPAGELVATYASPPTRIGALMQMLGLVRLLPDAVRARIMAPSPTVYLARASEPPATR